MAENSIHSKLLAIQKELPALSKDATNPFHKSKYVTLYNLLQTVLPILNNHGLVLYQAVTYTDNESPYLETSISNGSDKLTSSMLLMLKTPDPQAQGSAITYARRYSLMALLGLVGAEEDDDAQAAQKVINKTTGEVIRPASPAQKNMLIKAFSEANGAEATEEDVANWAGTFGIDWSELTHSDVQTLLKEIREVEAEAHNPKEPEE